MHCCKCHKKYDSFHASSWIKLTYSTMSNIKIQNALYNPGTVTSEPYYLLCPWCFEYMFDGCKPRVDTWNKTSKECSVPSVTTYTETEPITISLTANTDNSHTWIPVAHINDTERVGKFYNLVLD